MSGVRYVCYETRIVHGSEPCPGLLAVKQHVYNVVDSQVQGGASFRCTRFIET